MQNNINNNLETEKELEINTTTETVDNSQINEENNITENIETNQNNKKTKAVILTGAAMLSLLAGGIILNNKNKEELPQFSMEDGEIVLDDITDENKDIKYTFNIPDNITYTQNHSIDITKKATKPFEILGDEYIYSMQNELKNGDIIEIHTTESNKKTYVLQYDRDFNIQKSFEIKNKRKFTEFDYPIALDNENVFLVNSKYNDASDTLNSTLAIYDSKGNVKNSIDLKANHTVYYVDYLKEIDKIAVVFEDLNENCYLSLYDKNLKDTSQFKIGKQEYIGTISIDEDTLTIISTEFKQDNESGVFKNSAFKISNYDLNGKLLSSKKEELPSDVSVFDVITSEKGFIIKTYIESAEDKEITNITEIDKDGNIIWEIKDIDNSPFSVIPFDTKDGIVIITDTAISSNEDKDVCAYIPTIIKYDYSGNEIWKKYLAFNPEIMENFDYHIFNHFLINDNQIKIQASNYNNDTAKAYEFIIDSNGDFVTNK